jgi:hypothetical protein
MRMLACLAVMFACSSLPSSAQNDTSPPHQMTAPPQGARYEIIQSELAAKWTFRLDRFTGQVSQLVHIHSQDEYAWQEMEVVGRVENSQGARAKFQLFCSGLASRFIFLINTDTGKTWELTSSKKQLPDGTEQETNQWEPFTEN